MTFSFLSRMIFLFSLSIFSIKTQASVSEFQEDLKSPYHLKLPGDAWRNIWNFMDADHIMRQALSSHESIIYTKDQSRKLIFPLRFPFQGYKYEYEYEKHFKDAFPQQLPTIILNFQKLTTLSLAITASSVNLPSTLSQVTTLRTFEMEHFNLHPSSRNLSNNLQIIASLTFLKELALINNWLESVPNNFSCLTNLITFRLTSQEIRTLPEGFSNLTTLKKLDLRENKNFTTFPMSFSNLTCLNEINCHSNMSLVSFPNSVFHFSSLSSLDLSYCSLATFPHNFSFMSNLRTLKLTSHKFTNGLLPESMSKLTNLTYLAVGQCGLTTLSLGLSNLMQLEHAYLFNNPFESRSLPNAVSHWKNLRTLHVSRCRLGTLPETLIDFSNLTELDASGNQFDGQSVPSVIPQLTSLIKLNISTCNFKDFPTNLSNLTSLTSLNISDDNEFIPTPAFIRALPKLKNLTEGWNHDPTNDMHMHGMMPGMM